MNAEARELDFFFDEMADYELVYDQPKDEDAADKPRKHNYITTFDPKEVYSPAERIAHLMASVKSTSKVLVSTLELCAEMQPIATVNSHIDSQQKSNASVYSAETLCHLLEEAGALQRVYADGTTAADIDAEPTVVVENGVGYLEIPRSQPSFWITTEDGSAYLATYDPADQLAALFAEQPQYAEVYRLVMDACKAEGGATAQQLADLINKRDDVQSPRRYSSYFVDQLQERLALEWTGKAWRATDLGAAAIC